MNRHLLLSCMLISFALVVQAEQSFEFSGFGNIGAVYNDSTFYTFRQGTNQENDVLKDEVDFGALSTLGLQIDYSANSSFNFAYQAVFTEQNGLTIEDLTQLAFIAYTPNSNWALRLGRTAFDLFLLSDYRDVKFGLPWSHTPIETYGFVPYRFIDGIDARYTTQFENFTLSTKAFFGQSQSEFNISRGFNPFELDFKKGLGFSIDLQGDQWLFAVKYADVNLENEITGGLIYGINTLVQSVPDFENLIWPSALAFAEELGTIDATTIYWSAGGRYDFSQISIVSEISQVDSFARAVPKLNSAYISAIYYVSDYSFYSTFSFSNADKPATDNANFNRDLLASINPGILKATDAQLAFNSDQKTFSLGWRWNFLDNVALTLQWDHVTIGNGGSDFPLRPVSVFNQPDDEFNNLFVDVSFIF